MITLLWVLLIVSFVAFIIWGHELDRVIDIAKKLFDGGNDKDEHEDV